MIFGDFALPEAARARSAYRLDSGVHDLRPLLKTAMNADLRIDDAEAQTESPALLGFTWCPVTCWVGSAERPIHSPERPACHIWTGLVRKPAVEEPGATISTSIDGLADRIIPIVRTLLADANSVMSYLVHGTVTGVARPAQCRHCHPGPVDCGEPDRNVRVNAAHALDTLRRGDQTSSLMSLAPRSFSRSTRRQRS